MSKTLIYVLQYGIRFIARISSLLMIFAPFPSAKCYNVNRVLGKFTP